jgi:hypothetical protein
VWQVLGSNQRRLSRRFYSTLLLPESPPADQRIRPSRRVCGPPPSAMRPWAPGSVGRAAHGRARTSPRTGAEKATDGAGGSGYANRSHPDSPLTCRFRMPARCRRRRRHRGLPRRPVCRGPRRCADWQRWPGRRFSGRRSSAGPRPRARRGGRPRSRAPRSSATATPPRAAGRRGGGRAATCTGRG